MSFNTSDISRNACQLFGAQAHRGYDWWWHSLTARHAVTGEERPFFFECFLCNPNLAEDEPTLGQLPANQAAGKRPSYIMVNCGTWGKDKTQLHRFFPWRDVKVDFGVTDIRCRKADMLNIKYEAPDGAFRHRRLWNGGNGTGTICLYRHGKLIDRIHATNIGCEYGEYTC